MSRKQNFFISPIFYPAIACILIVLSLVLSLLVAIPVGILASEYIFFGILILTLILLYIIHLIIQLWKYRRLNEESIKFFNQKEIDKEIIRLEEDIEITKKEFGIKHPNYLKILDKLASVYYSIKDYEQAEIVYDVALEIKEEVYGKKHPEYVKSLNELFNLYILTREFHKAEPLTQQSLKLNIEVYGKKHPEYIKSLNGLSNLYMLRGEFAKAEPLAQESLRLIQNIFEEKYMDYTLHLNNTSVLAELELLNRNFKSGFERLLRHSKLHDRMIIRMYYFSNEKKVQEYIRTFNDDYFKIISAISKYYSELNPYIPDVFDAILRRKTVALEISAVYRDRTLSDKNSELKEKLDSLRDSRRILAYLIMEGYRKLSPKDYKREICIYEQKIESLEKELIVSIPEFELRKTLENINYKIIAEYLPQKTSLAEFVRYEAYDFEKRKSLAPRYMVFIMSSHDKDNIRMADIGDASEIDELIRKYKETIAEEGRTIGVVPHSPPIAEDRLLIGKQLYEKLFKPVEDCIGDAEKLLISPDGSITLIPFEVLPMPDGSYVVENFEISYIDSSRDLIRFQYHQAPQSRSLILADPDFDLAEQEMSSDNSGFENITLFSRLYGTKEEGEAVKKLMPVSGFYTGKDVLDEKVKRMKGPEILHIATHGFFISEQNDDDNRLSEKLKEFENPLLRSGLALAGANAFLQGKSPAEYAGDGLLIASDVTGMDLTGTDLVVLSACQTGLGEVRSGEGIYGLRRAFTIAGARTQIVSLWSVPDQETKELMVSFYTKLSDGKGKAEALREAQRELIAKLRNEGKADSPFYWGAFICVGDPDKMERTSSF